MADYAPIEALTEREIEILAAMAEGKSNPEIAATLHLALTTVKWYNTQIYGKLGVSNRKEAIQAAQRLAVLTATKVVDTATMPNNLPPQSTPFVGRGIELRELAALLNTEAIRLITILGAGGMGKTRLGLEFAQRQMPQFENGVFWIQLAPLSFPETVLPAIADTFSLYDYDETADLRQKVLDFLADKEMLLLFDNFEHLLKAAAHVHDLLQAAPKLKILVTSRERLNLSGETVFTLSGMPFPKESQDDFLDFDAVRLFVQAVRRVRPDYELNDYDLPHIVEVCNLVEGMPLALELAAGWMDTLTVEKIADEIRRCSDFLESELRDIPERHRSIRATFQSSWESLSETEQQVMMQLAVFRGGFRQEAAEAVAGADIRLLKRLVNKSLLSHNPFGRYEIHELLRQFSEEYLHEAGLYAAACAKHAQYFAAYSCDLLQGITAMDGKAHLIFAADLDNFAFAWNYVLTHEKFQLLDSLEDGVWWFMSTQGRTYEGVEWFTAAVNALRPHIDSTKDLRLMYAENLVNLANLQTTVTPLEEHKRTIEEAIEILEEFGTSSSLAWAYLSQADYHYKAQAGEHGDSGLESLFKAYDMMKALGLEWQTAENAKLLGMAYTARGDFAVARKYLEEAIAIVRRVPEAEGFLQFNTYLAMGFLLLCEERYAEADNYADEALFLAERAEWVYGISGARNLKADLAIKRGDIQEAKGHIASILHWHQSHASDWQMLGALYGCYGRHFLFNINDLARAVEIWAYVYEHPRAFTAARVVCLHLLEQAEASMSPDAYAAAYGRAKGKHLGEVVAEAMAFLKS